jgi:hypothetical protein
MAQGPEILTELFNPVMDGDLAFRQQRLKGELADFRQTARLREGQALLLEQRQRKFLLQLGFADVKLP